MRHSGAHPFGVEAVREYGVLRGNKRIAGRTEEEVFAQVGLPYIPPELQENQGEIEAAVAQRRDVAAAAGAIASIATDHPVVVTHGNGPQVSLLALQALANRGAPAYPLDILGSESDGMIGYLIERQSRNHLPGREIATPLTMVVVRGNDPTFNAPTKPIGPIYEPEEGARLAHEQGWRFRPDGGGVRRIVPSPEPVRVLEIAAIRTLVRAGVVTI